MNSSAVKLIKGYTPELEHEANSELWEEARHSLVIPAR